MSVTPTALPSINSAAPWHPYFEYRFRYSTSTHAYYDLWDYSVGGWLRTLSLNKDRIKVGIDPAASDYNTWTDEGTVDPVFVVESNGVIQLQNSLSVLLYEFTKPTTASWISSGGSGGGGTTTEGTGDPVPVGSKYFNNLDQLVFVVGSSSPTSDADIVYKIFRGPDRYNMTQVFVLSHTNGSDTEYNVGDPSSFKRWELRLESNDVQYDSQILVDYSAGKVSCNFW